MKWRCTTRNSQAAICQAMVTQQGDSYTRGTADHCHEAESGAATKAKIRRKVKDECAANPYKSAFTIAERVVLGKSLYLKF